MPPKTDAVTYYLSRAEHFRAEAKQVAHRPRYTGMLLELAAAFQKRAEEMARLLGAIPTGNK